MNAVSLTKRELSRLVGTDAKEHQIAWLQAKGWPYVLNWAGDIVVGRDAAAKRLDNPATPAPRRAKLEAVR